MAAIPRLSLLTRTPSIRLPSLAAPTLGGLGAGLAVAATVALLSTDTLEHLVWTSGVAALVPAAQPPLGATARLLLALGGGVAAGAVAWAALFLLFGPGGFLAARAGAADRPGVRRADAHPDAPPRRPMTAADLGTPLMEVAPPSPPPPPPPTPVERPLPRDLDQPLAAFDPGAVPLVAREPLRAVPALAPGERIDTFALTPPPPASRPIKREPASAQTIEALLRRLEEGAGRRTVRG